MQRPMGRPAEGLRSCVCSYTDDPADPSTESVVTVADSSPCRGESPAGPCPCSADPPGLSAEQPSTMCPSVTGLYCVADVASHPVDGAAAYAIE